jgi:hypothetical protein
METSTSFDRVRAHTPAHVLDRLDSRTAARVFRAARGGPEAIERRIRQIDREWDIDRWVELGAAVATFASSRRGRTSRLWWALFRAQQLALVLHATVGWAPPVGILRRLGVRTQKEIDTERAVLVELLHLLREDDQVFEVIAYEETTSPGTAVRW